MGLSLFQPTINVSTIPFFYPAPADSDVWNCDEFYSRSTNAHVPPPIADCRKAFKLLPTGTTAIPWYTQPESSHDNVLPIVVQHGGCQIAFHTSGPAADDGQPAWIIPNDIRDMASWVIGKCIFGKKGGMVTKNLENAIKLVTDPKLSDKEWLEETSYYSLHIWNYDKTNFDWNPGNSDPEVGQNMVNALGVAAGEASGDDKPVLEERFDLVAEAVSYMQRNYDKRVWWEA